MGPSDEPKLKLSIDDDKTKQHRLYWVYKISLERLDDERLIRGTTRDLLLGLVLVLVIGFFVWLWGGEWITYSKTAPTHKENQSTK